MGLLIPIRTLSASSSEYLKGIHRGHPFGLQGIEPDLIAENIKWNTTIFGIMGTMVIWRRAFGKNLSLPALPSISKSINENHSGGSHLMNKSWAVPAISSISENVELSYAVLDDCEAAWDEYVAADVISTIDVADFKVGTGSQKIDVASNASVGRLATNNFGPLDGPCAYNYLKFWIKSSIAINTNELSILLDDTSGCTSPIKDLNIGVLTANVWTEKTLALGDPSGLGALISIGIDMDIDKGAFTLRVDQVRLTKGA